MLVQSEMKVVESFMSAEETWAEWSRGVVAVGVGAVKAVTKNARTFSNSKIFPKFLLIQVHYESPLPGNRKPGK